jgi:DNA-binding GntR family transcriptional regulator
MRSTVVQDDGDGDRSVAGRIASVLAMRIVKGTLAPGVPIRQDHVAMEFNASHVPVREAFRMLEGQGLLVSEPRRGVRVAPLDPATVHEITQMRAVLEALALRHAMPRMTAAAIAAAEHALSGGDIAMWEETNRRFHRALVAPCAMPRLLSQLDDLHRVSARFLFATWQGLDWQPRSDKEHREILRLVKLGDALQADAVLAAHVTSAGEALIASLAQRPSQDLECQSSRKIFNRRAREYLPSMD